MHFRCYLERCGSTLPIDISITALDDDDGVVGSVATDDNDDDSYSIKSNGADEGSREPAPSFSTLAMDRCMDSLAPQITR